MSRADHSDPTRAFRDVAVWIFDLDNTLYAEEHGVFDQIDRRMTEFISAELGVDARRADEIRQIYWSRHGTTLNGLMKEDGVAPERFLDHVHDVDLSHMPARPDLAAALARLPGRKLVHTNGSREHARRVLARLGAAEAFEAVFAIEDTDYAPKPAPAAYAAVCAAAEVDPTRAAMFEDTARNLEIPHAMGMRTVWTPTSCARASDGAEGAHVHFTAEDLVRFLEGLIEGVDLR